MGLRCLLGHDFGNREVERERQETGDEVVVTYRTVETCQRCGDRRVVSENKEIRSIRASERGETGLATGGGGTTVESDTGAESDDSATPDAEAEVDEGTEIIESTDDGQEPAENDDAAETVTDESVDDIVEQVEAVKEETAEPDDGDGGIILSDDEDDTGRQHGEWPDADVDQSGASPVSETKSPASDEDAVLLGDDDGWPEPEGEDEGFDAEPVDDTDSGVELGGGLSPQTDAGTDAGADAGTDAGADAGTNGHVTFADADETAADSTPDDKEFVRAEDASVDIHRSEPNAVVELYCPNCGHSRTAGHSSMRAGDICPECRKGYIAEREH